MVRQYLLFCDCVGHLSPIGLFPLNGHFKANDASAYRIPGGHVVLAKQAEGVYGQPDGSYIFSAGSYILIENKGNLDLPHSATILFWVKSQFVDHSHNLLSYSGASNSGASPETGFALSLKARSEGYALLALGYCQSCDLNIFETQVKIQYDKWWYIGVIYNHESKYLYFWKEDHIEYEKSAPGIGFMLHTQGLDLLLGEKLSHWEFNMSIACVQIYNVALDARQIDAARNICENLDSGEKHKYLCLHILYLLKRAPWRSFILGGFRCGA